MTIETLVNVALVSGAVSTFLAFTAGVVAIMRPAARWTPAIKIAYLTVTGVFLLAVFYLTGAR